MVLCHRYCGGTASVVLFKTEAALRLIQKCIPLLVDLTDRDAAGAANVLSSDFQFLIWPPKNKKRPLVYHFGNPDVQGVDVEVV